MKTLFFEYPVWFLLFCIIAGLAYALLLYTAKAPWGKTTDRLLGVVRFVVVFIICLLLLGPYFRTVVNQLENAELVFAIDNSQSMLMGNAESELKSYVAELKEMAAELNAKDVNTTFYALNGSTDTLDQIRFEQRATNLGGMLQEVEEVYENKNLAGIVLLTDGLFNQGYSPEYLPLSVPMHTIGTGDTTAKKDILAKTVYSNKIAYLGNRFPIAAELEQYGFGGRTINVKLSSGSTVVEQQNVTFGDNEQIKRVNFLVKADKVGTQQYQISIEPLAGEYTKDNNRQSTYIDIIDDREEILIVAATPHPDIKALKSAIEKSKNYQVSTYIPQLAAYLKRETVDLDRKYDLVVFHQIPQRGEIRSDIFDRLYQNAKGVLFIVGQQTDVQKLNSLGLGVSVQARSGMTDLVTPAFNPNFDRFLFKEESRGTITDFPPVIVPFGETKAIGNAQVVLFQQVGRIVTDKPLMTYTEKGDQKIGVLMGEGLWKWRLQNFALEENTEAFDELMGKIVQFVATKADKRRFRVYPQRNEYFEGETVGFETEVYNEIYEQIYGQEITLKLTNGIDRSYTYTNSPNLTTYDLKSLTPGVYRFEASTLLDGKPTTATGGFVVKELAIEALDTRADHRLLRNISAKTAGQFVKATQLDQLKQELMAKTYKPMVFSEDEDREVIHFYWILFLLLGLATAEWGIRKYMGWY